MFVGRNEVVGQAVPLYEPIVTPFSQTPAVWFSWDLERWQKSGDNSSWVTQESRQTAAPFWLQDDTGRVLVRPRGAELEPVQTLCEKLDSSFAPPYSRWQLRQWVLMGEDTTERMQSLTDASFLEAPSDGGGFFNSAPDTVSPISNLSGKWRITEKVIAAGAPIYLLGTAAPRTDGPGLEFAGSAGDLLVSTKSEEQVAKSSGWSARLCGLGCLLLSAVFVGAASDAVFDEVKWFLIVWTLGFEVGILFLLTLQRNYNRQVEVKEQAAKAWSLIDVSLQRRSELIPNLVEVVKQYTKHEREVQEAVAELRAVPEKPPTEELPSDATLEGAQNTDRGLKSAAKTTVALAEDYPDLKASQVYLDLQLRIADAEESVASSRQFYNDAIEVLRTRRSQFPGSLFARFVEVPSWKLFEAEEAATFVPSVAIAPSAAPTLDPAAAAPATPPDPPGASTF
ncbi:MAG: e3 ubiquitin ligase [Ilumatobacteraceae bacterium]|nr:e3 ubiquitin ligase [Ilumatobacteraceae bacterium]